MEQVLAVYAAISSLCGGRVYTDRIPDINTGEKKALWPAIRVTQVGGSANNTNCYTDYIPRLQFDVFADTQKERDQIVQQLQDVLENLAEVMCEPNSCPIHAWDFERKKFQAVLDYTIS